MATFQLSASALAAVNADFKIGNYPSAYRAIRDDLVAQNAAAVSAGLPPPIDADTITWYTNAPEINDINSTSFIHYFARDYVSDYAKITTGSTTDATTFENVSNTLGHRLIMT